MAIDMEKLNEEITAFKDEYESADLEDPAVMKKYAAGVEKLLVEYPNPDKEAAEALGKLCSYVGCCMVMDGGDLDLGVKCYRKSLELAPDDYDVYWDYFTTLEEVIEDEEYRTPELVDDTIKCLRFCIDYCDTPEKKEEHRVHFRYIELARVYFWIGELAKAREYVLTSLDIEESEGARDLLDKIDDRLANK